MVEILKPILKLKSTNIISTGIDDWSDYNNEVLKQLCVIKDPTVPATNVFISELNKAQTIKELNRIKSRISDESLTKAQKNKLLTKLYDIEREIILDNDMLEEKIEEIIATVSSTEINKYVKNSSALLNL
jgi:hypothetical protein